MFRIKLVPIPGDECGMLPDELETQCLQLEVHGVFLMPSCSNPTTVMISENRKKELAAIIRKHNLILIEDDIYAFLTAGIIADYDQPMFQLIPEQTVYICSTSKSICSGLRVAYIVFSDAFKEKIIKAIFNINVKTSSLDAEIITELILSGKANAIVEEKKQLAQSANHIYSEFFSQSFHTGHPLSFYSWLPISDNGDGSRMESAFLQKGIRVFHSNRFLCGANTQDKFLRIALASTNSLDELKRGLEILKGNLR
ncbi:DNA-binding transcriptional MocR family regulator [Paenibacillus sp. V4I9]|nr:DNA-binding transcriptional MocR family regulator [Paenibacillus sp. V4I9]